MYEQLLEELNQYKAKLVAVSKMKSNADILDLYEKGQRIFGENVVKDLTMKMDQLPDDIQWHMIGHLQRNKVKYLIPRVDMIHSVDSLRLLKEIDKRAGNHEIKQKILLQVVVAQEETKHGFNFNNLIEFHEGNILQSFPNVEVCGVMGMATFTVDEELVRNEFQQLKIYFDTLKERFYKDKDTFCEISMGMSGDYKIALEEGATMVRIGSLLFGPRACAI
jgi:pyridoxal phosphate enzyme (YggS family)